MASGRLVRTAAVTAALLLIAGGAFGGCSPSSNAPSDSGAGGAADGSCTNGGGPVPGDADGHCTDADGKATVQETSTAACMDSGAAGAPNTSPGSGGAAAVEEMAPVLFNAEGDDDDYSVGPWTTDL